MTWNVNSIKQRLPRVLAMIRRHEPDVVCLQETKVEDPLFPTMELVAAGYECATFGQRAYNGVAILSRVGLKEARTGFDGDPIPEPRRSPRQTLRPRHSRRQQRLPGVDKAPW